MRHDSETASAELNVCLTSDKDNKDMGAQNQSAGIFKLLRTCKTEVAVDFVVTFAFFEMENETPRAHQKGNEVKYH